MRPKSYVSILYRPLGATVGIVASLVVTGCSDLPGNTHQLTPCGAEELLLCGRVPVPEDRTRDDSRQVDLNVVVVPAVENTPGSAPLFFLEGGPGIAATEIAEFFMSAGSAYRRNRDVVLVDMRGTGDSRPLRCPELELSGADVPRQLGEIYPSDEVAACRDRLGRVADVTQYTTRNAALDLEVVRQSLGYRQIDIQALSYGTRLGQAYLRAHPDRVRKFVAIGVVSPGYRTPLLHAPYFQRAFDLLLEDCESDDACRAAFPNLADEWSSLVKRLALAPARVSYAPEDTSIAIDLEIPRGVFVEKIRSQMYLASSARKLPGVVSAAARGDFVPFLEMTLRPADGGPAPLAEGLYLSVTCAEDLPLISSDDIALHSADTYLGDYRVEQQREACTIWPRASSIPEPSHPDVSAVPALFITGERDPVTPPTEASRAAEVFTNATVIVVPHAGHIPFDVSDPSCLDNIMLSFFERPDVEAIDTSCIDDLSAPPFVLPSK